jgi:hypothetical protein
MSIKIMTEVWDSHGIENPTHLLLLLAIADHANDEGAAYPSVPNLMKKCRIASPITFRKARQWLCERGYLSIDFCSGPGKEGRKTNIYRIEREALKPATISGYPQPVSTSDGGQLLTPHQNTPRGVSTSDPLIINRTIIEDKKENNARAREVSEPANSENGSPSLILESGIPAPKKGAGRKPGHKLEVKTYFQLKGWPTEDAWWFWNHLEAQGWTNNKQPVKDWKALANAWQVAGYMPSQKKLRFK